MVEGIVILVVMVIAALLIFAARKPDMFRVERSISIHVPPEKIFPLLDDFRRWEEWSPWEKVDPEISRLYSGTPNGEGAVYEWSGNKQIGEGRLEIVESLPPSKLLLRIDFIKPIQAHNTLEFTLKPHNGSTILIQAMYGPSPYISRLMSMFFGMDKMVGRKYEEGLANIKAIAEK